MKRRGRRDPCRDPDHTAVPEAEPGRLADHAVGTQFRVANWSANGQNALSAAGLVEPEESRTLKREHLGIDEATDALAFPIDGRDAIPDGLPRQLGDIVLCPQVVGEMWRAPLIHALLHLVGYDHGPEMEAREAVYAA